MIRFFLLLNLLTNSALAASTEALPANDRLARTVSRIAAQLADGNITSGTTTLQAKRLKDGVEDKNFRALTTTLFEEAFQAQTGEKLPARARLQVRTEKFSDEQVEELAVALGEGNAYDDSNPENTKGLARQAWVVLRRLPVEEGTKVGIVKTRLRQDASDADSARNVYFFVFYSPEERELVQYFIIEGRM
jgi:hypothetical protein